MLEFLTNLLNHKEELAVIGTSLVTIASALANIVSKDSKLGKALHFLALNFKVK